MTTATALAPGRSPARKRAPRKRARATGAPPPTSPTLAHVHETREPIAVVELTPPHPPRTETPEYAAAHHFLTRVKKAGCEVCGVTIDALADPAANPFGAADIETHHYPIERSLMDACDPLRVHADFPQVYDQATLAAFVDSQANLKVLCDQHHRSAEHGIHHLLPQDFAVQKYLRTGYIVAAPEKDAAAALAADERIERAAGLEPESAANPTPASPPPSPAPAAPVAVPA